MKKVTTILGMSLAAALGCAQMKPAAGGNGGSGDAALFESLKKLAGRWESGDADKDGQPDATTVYRVTAGDPARDRHMGALTLTLVDSDHLKQEWVTYSDGKPGARK